MAATLVAGLAEEAIRRRIKGGTGATVGSAVGAMIWPKVRDEVRRWLRGGWGRAPARGQRSDQVTNGCIIRGLGRGQTSEDCSGRLVERNKSLAVMFKRADVELVKEIS